MLKRLHILLAWFSAVAVAYGLGAVFHTQFVLQRMLALGAPVPAAVRGSATLHDLAGLAATYLPLIALAFALALPVASLVIRILPLRRFGFGLAGGAALLCVHLLVEHFTGLTLLAGARGWDGLGAQVLAGVLGGLTYAELAPRRHRRADEEAAAVAAGRAAEDPDPSGPDRAPAERPGGEREPAERSPDGSASDHTAEQEETDRPRAAAS